ALKHELTDRDRFLRQACREDEQLLQEIRSLLSSYERPNDFFETPKFSAGLDLLAVTNDQLSPGTIFGSYSLERRIGRGGMGDVYLARDARLGRQVALKLLSARFQTDAEWNSRFQQEARAASAIAHPNIAHIYEVGEVDGRQYIAMEYIDGMTLRERLKPGPL